MPPQWQHQLAALMLLAHWHGAIATVTVSNVVPRTDTDGAYMDAHDGNTVQFTPDGPYYWYAMGYGKCIENGVSADGSCGSLSNSTVGVWTSPDLTHGSWKKVGGMRMSSDGWPKCTYYRSHAVYSKRSRKYVMWLNAEPGKDSACTACKDPAGGAKESATHCYLAGTSDSPEGPFVYQGVVPVRYTYEGGVGDFELFVDDDGTGYAAYKRTGAAGVFGHRMTLQQLTPDFLDVLQNASVGMEAFAAAPFVEAPAMFKRKGVYYALFGKCCAFCAHGTGVGVWTSAGSPLGPWVGHGNIGCNSSKVAHQQTCGCGMAMPKKLANGTVCPKDVDSISHAQQNSVIRLAAPKRGKSDSPSFLWTGDRWQSACRDTVAAQGISPLGPDLHCVKAWDYQYWSPLVFDETRHPALPEQMVWQNTVTLDIDAATDAIPR